MSKLAKVKVNLPLLLAASVLPDVDLLLRFLTHRGPTHSFIIMTVLMIPFFVVYRKQAIPYYAALLSHILIGDFFIGGIQLFWPLSQAQFGFLNLNVLSLSNVIAELALFGLTLPIMYKLNDLQTLVKPHNKNLALIIPIVAVLGPLLAVGRGQENALPTLLVAPSLFYVGLFAYSMFVELRAGHNQDNKKLKRRNTPQLVLLNFANKNCYRSYVTSVLEGLEKSQTRTKTGQYHRSDLYHLHGLEKFSFHFLHIK
jgi:membrane-bound metal-dependent hydrolase YbcI (DUF457 family)